MVCGYEIRNKVFKTVVLLIHFTPGLLKAGLTYGYSILNKSWWVALFFGNNFDI